MPWRLEQLQLHFYNGCDNRWQLFREGLEKPQRGTDSGPYFRIQIAALLTTIRTAFEPKLGKRRSAKLRREVIIDLRNFDEEIQEMASQFSAFLKEALREEGVTNKALASAISSEGQWSVPRDAMATLLSLLPIARDWDIYGWLHPMSTSIKRFEPECYWWRRFAYHVRFEPHSNPTDDQPLKDRSVYLRMFSEDPFSEEAQCQKKLEPIPPNTNPTREIPYFDFAKSPIRDRADNLRKKMTDEEWKLYQLYAAVVDSAQQSGVSEATSYFFVFPIIACGYYHFLELKMVSTGDSHSESLEDSYAFVRNRFFRHDAYEYHVMKESIRELLVQIRLSAFQHHVANWIAQNAYRILSARILDPNLAVECFCKSAPLINEMRAIVTPDGVWCHAGRDEDDTSDASRVWKVLKRWGMVSRDCVRNWGRKECSIFVSDIIDLPASNYRRVTIGGVAEIWLFREADSKFALDFFEGTNELRLAEQFEVVQERVRRVWSVGGR
jgi:hypothetical protein